VDDARAGEDDQRLARQGQRTARFLDEDQDEQREIVVAVDQVDQLARAAHQPVHGRYALAGASHICANLTVASEACQ
jgi:hypothetical protein